MPPYRSNPSPCSPAPQDYKYGSNRTLENLKRETEALARQLEQATAEAAGLRVELSSVQERYAGSDERIKQLEDDLKESIAAKNFLQARS